MQPRESRFCLRILSGARQGEEVPLTDGVSSVGRRPDNPIVIADASVSSRHAELRVADAEVTLKDLGSTNGTRVGGKKIESRSLAHGDQVRLGAVEMVFFDRTMDGVEEFVLEEPLDAPVVLEASGDSPARARSAPGGTGGTGGTGGSGTLSGASPAAAADEVERVDAEVIARAGKRSKLGLLLLPLLLLAAGAVAFVALRERSASGEQTRALVENVPDNLLGDYSFEDPESDALWVDADAAPQAFFRDGAFADRGALGLGVVLEAGEWAFARSPAIDLTPRRRLAVAAALRVEDGALGRIGVELSNAQDSAPSFIAWAPAASDSGSAFEDVRIAFDTFSDYDRARVVVAARGDRAGAVSLDDVSFVLERDTGGPTASFNEFELHILGQPGSTAALVRSGRPALPRIGFGRWSAAGLQGPGTETWSANATETGFTLNASPATDPARLHVLLRGLDEEGGDSTPWIATMGAGGYRSHAGDIDRAEVDSFLAGRDLQLLRLGFGGPARVRGQVQQGSLPLVAEGAALGTLELQLTFAKERAEANLLADRARSAEQSGDLGSALASLSELLDRYPFDGDKIEEAESARSRLIQTGLGRIEEVRQEVERARFFGLVDLYRQSRDRALAIAEGFAGSEVESEARDLALEIETELEGLESTDSGGEAQRLSAVLRALDPTAQPGLYRTVQSALESLGAGERSQ